MDKKVITGGHVNHIRYIDMGDGNTIAWPEELTVKKAFALLNNDSTTVLTAKDTLTKTGVIDFILFWKTPCQRTYYRYYLEWPYDGPPSFSEPEKVGTPIVIRKFERSKRLILFFVLMAFGLGIFIGRTGDMFLRSFKETPKISWAGLIVLLLLPLLPFTANTNWYNGLIESTVFTITGGIGILIGAIYQKIKDITSIRNFGFSSSRIMEIPNTNDDRLPNEHNL